MPLIDYKLRPPSQVILADSRDPYVSWLHHLERTWNDPGGPRGGVDIVAPVGTPVYARTAGVMLHVPKDGGAGNSCRFHHDHNRGWKDVFSHLSSYVAASGQHFEAGEVVAYTGNTGGVSPHLHWHLLDPSNVRRNPWDYFSSSGTAGDGYTPIEEEDMPKLIRNYDGSIGLVSASGELDAISNLDEVRALQASGIVSGGWAQMSDGLVWNLLTARTARLRAQRSAIDVDEAAIASQLGPLVVSPILEAIRDELAEGGIELTQAQLEAAAEAGVRRVFADASA